MSKSSNRWDAEAMQSQKQAERYLEMASALRSLRRGYKDEDLDDEISRFERLAKELEADAQDRWAKAHTVLTGRR